MANVKLWKAVTLPLTRWREPKGLAGIGLRAVFKWKPDFSEVLRFCWFFCTIKEKDWKIKLTTSRFQRGIYFKTQSNIYNKAFPQKSSIVDLRLGSKYVCGLYYIVHLNYRVTQFKAKNTILDHFLNRGRLVQNLNLYEK